MNCIWNRLENESDEELIYRVCSQKDKIGTWQDVANILNDLLNEYYNESKYRKQYQAFEKMLNANQSKIIDGDAYIKEIEVAKRELQKERIKLQTEKLEYNRWLREQARDELFEEKVIEAIKDNLNKTPIPQDIEFEENEIGGQLNIADCHFGKEYKVYNLNNEILNEYSPEIFYERMEKIYNETVKIGKQNNLKVLHVNNLGDEVDGFLRHKQIWTLRYGVTESAVLFGNYIGHWLKKLSEHFHVIYNYTSGNHDEFRLLDGRKGDHLTDNSEIITVNCIKLINEGNPNFKIRENKTGLIFDNIVGYNFIGIHGEVKNLQEAIRDYENLYDIKVDYLLAGHKHFNEYTNCGTRKGVIGVASVVGADDFSVNSLRKKSDASASFIIYEKEKGKKIDYTIVLN